jgi:membrane-bound metal-dependent hydrolase YbcI (DUF457 family)
MVPVSLGAVVGTLSHIVLDSIMHRDITPLSPFSQANPMFRVVSLSTLHWFCIASGAVALLVMALQRMLRDESAP